jgi:hypothetical protein
MRVIVFLLAFFRLLVSRKYLGGDNDDYSLDKPGNDLVYCLSGEAHECFVTKDYSRNFGTEIYLNQHPSYAICGLNLESYVTLIMEGDFLFGIGDEQYCSFVNLKVYFFCLFAFMLIVDGF